MAVDAATTGRGEATAAVGVPGGCRGAQGDRDDGLRWLEEGGGEPGTA